MSVLLTFRRLIRHTFSPKWWVARYFTPKILQQITSQIIESEPQHLGQIRFVIESHWAWFDIIHQKTPHQRALEWFGRERIWDTEHNTGILIYISFADKAVEIIADRGINQQITANEWQAICNTMSPYFTDKNYVAGFSAGLNTMTQLLIQKYPRTDSNFHNELSDEIIIH